MRTHFYKMSKLVSVRDTDSRSLFNLPTLRRYIHIGHLFNLICSFSSFERGPDISLQILFWLPFKKLDVVTSLNSRRRLVHEYVANTVMTLIIIPILYKWDNSILSSKQASILCTQHSQVSDKRSSIHRKKNIFKKL